MKKQLSFSSRFRNEAQGIALIYVVILMPALITLAAFVINLGISYASLEQARGYTRLMSLLSLEHYNELNKNVRIRAAATEVANEFKKRINAVAQENRILGNKSEEFMDFGVARFDTYNENMGGFITPGYFYYEKPQPPVLNVDLDTQPIKGMEDITDPCGEMDLPYPCFVPSGSMRDYTLSSAVNAMRVEARYIPPFSARLFHSFLGDTRQEIKTCAISSFMPSNIEIIVDISGSSVANTHKRSSMVDQIVRPNVAGRGGHFAFERNVENNESNPEICAQCFTDVQFSYSKACTACLLRFHVGNPAYTTSYDGDPAHNTLPSPDPLYREAATAQTTIYGGCVSGGCTPVEHFIDDYEEVRPLGPINAEDRAMHPTAPSDPNEKYGGAGLLDSVYLIDHYTDPEPYTSIFKSLYSIVQTIGSRNIAGDRVGYIFMERKLVWSRIVNLTNDYLYLKKVASFPEEKDYILNLGIFPSKYDNTDIGLALGEAMTQILNNRIASFGSPTQDSVIYIGDFLPNCTNRSYLSKWVLEGRSLASYCAAFPADQQPEICDASIERPCSDEYRYYAAAIEELWDIVRNDMIPNKISLNVVLLGQHVSPHLIDLADPNDTATPPRCLNLEEMQAQGRMYGTDFVKKGYLNTGIPTTIAEWETYYRNMGTIPFSHAGYEAAKLVAASGGIFAPVLASCSGSGQPCNPNSIRTTDRSCRSAEMQLKAHLNHMINAENPYRLVNTDCEF